MFHHGVEASDRRQHFVSFSSYQFARPSLKNSSLLTATDLDTFNRALSQVDEKDQVIISVLTSILVEEANCLDVSVLASSVCSEVITRLLGICLPSPICQVWLVQHVSTLLVTFSFVIFVLSLSFVGLLGATWEVLSAEVVQQFLPCRLRGFGVFTKLITLCTCLRYLHCVATSKDCFSMIGCLNSI